MCIKLNKNDFFIKSLIMYHYFICCKLKFGLHKNNKIYIEHTHYYKLTLQISFKTFN